MSDDIPNKYELFAKHPLLQHLEPAELQRILKYTVEKTYKAGPEELPIFSQGDPGTGMMAVLKGRISINVTSEAGKEVILRIIEPGEIFGEIALIDGQARSANAIPLEDSLVAILYRRDFLGCLEKNPKIAIGMLQILCQSMRRTTEQISNIGLNKIEARLARLLLDLADLYGEETNQGIYIKLKLFHKDLGSFIAATRESVHAHLREWKKEGIISIDKNGYITILQIEKLKRLAHEVGL